jgi:hypothetical protein
VKFRSPWYRSPNELVPSSSSPRRKSKRRNRPSNIRLEPLEARRMMVVGALAVPPLVAPGTGFDGVVALDFSNASTTTTLNADFTGVLLYDGRHILTTAQAFDRNRDGVIDDDLGSFQVVFEMNKQHYAMSVDVNSTNIVLAPGWIADVGDDDGTIQDGADLAIVTLPFIAPFPAERYNIFRVPADDDDENDNPEIGSLFTLVGYGESGTGDSGSLPNSKGIKRIGNNVVEAIDDEPNGDLLRVFFNAPPGGVNESEAVAAFADRGAPAFLSKLPDGSTIAGGPVIAGLYSFEDTGNPDAEVNQFGITERYTRVSGFASFIDTTLAAQADIVLNMNMQPLGNDGTADQVTVRLDPNVPNGDPKRLQILVDGEVVWSDLLTHVNSLKIIGSGDDDTMLIAKDIDLNVDITLDGGIGFDSFELIGDKTNGGVYTPDATSPGAGKIVINSKTVTFLNFEPMTVSAMPSFTLTTPAGVDNVLVETGPSPGRMTVSGTNDGQAFESVTFFDITTFTIDVGANDPGPVDDIITLNAPVPALGLTSFVINAGTAGNDRVVYNGTSNNDTFTVGPTGSILLSNPSHDFVTVNSSSTGIDQVVLDGLDGDDTFEINQNNPFAGGLFLDGGNPSHSDVVNLNAPATFAQTVTIAPLATDQTRQLISNFANVVAVNNPITTSGIELINYNSPGDPVNDNLIVNLGTGDNVARVERSTDRPDDPTDEITSDSLPKIAFHTLASFEVQAGGGADVVTFKTGALAGAAPANYRFTGDARDTLAIEGSDSVDNYLLTKPAAGVAVAIRDAASNVVVTNTNTTLGQIQLNTLGGDDRATVDVGAATPSDLISVPILFDGGADRDLLTVQGTPPGANAVSTVTYTPGPAVHQGRLAYDGATSDMTIDFLNLEPVVDLVVAASLIVNGTNSPNTINYQQGSAATRGIVRVDEFESVEFENKTALVINGLGGVDNFVLDNANLPTSLTRITADGGAGNDIVTALNLPVVGTYLGTTLIGGTGDDILDAGAVTQNSPILLQGNSGEDSLTGGAGIDTYEGGADDDLLVASGANDTFDGGTGFDQLAIRGTKNNDVIDVFQVAPSGVAGDNYQLTRTLNSVATTLQVTKTIPANAPNDPTNRPTVEEVLVEGREGNDTIRVGHADAYTDTDATPAHLQITNNGVAAQMLRISVDGGAPDASDRLIVRDDGVGDLVLVREASTPGSGRVTVAPAVNNTTLNMLPVVPAVNQSIGDIVYTHIERVDVNPVDPITGGTGTDGGGRLVVFQADPFELNDTRLVPTEFTDLGTTNLNPTIDPGQSFAFDPAIPGDEDWYVFQPTKTSVYRLDLLFNQIAQVNSGRAGLPGDGNLDISVFDINGKLITTGVDVSGLGLVDLGEQPIGEQLTFGAQAGNHYYIRVKGHPRTIGEDIVVTDAINTYQIKLTDVDTIGPQVTKLYISDNPNTTADERDFDLLGTKSFPGATPGPTPLVNGITLDLKDLPGRALDFTYPALIGGTLAEVEQNNSIADGQNIDQYFNLNANTDIVNDLTVPHASILGTGDGTFDFYTFTIDAASAASPIEGRFDIDDQNFSPSLQLFNEAGVQLATGTTLLVFNFTAPGKYSIRVGRDNAGTPAPVLAGQTYTLHVSIVDHPILLNPGLITVKGDANGVIPIKEVRFIPDPNPQVIGQAATGKLEITFFSPLPDDRYTLTFSDHVTDPANNPLDGESNASEPQPSGPPTPFPSGNGTPGGDFTARFTVDSRPEIATYAGLNVATDLNGNSTFDPTNVDFTNRDAIFQFGTVNDQRFAGKFGDASNMGLRFDMLSAYGRDPVSGRYRFLIDWNFNGAVDPGDYIDSPLQIDGLAVAGNFTGAANSKDEIAIFDGTKWYIDVLGGATVVSNGQRGYPIAGDFDGDGRDDLATYQSDTFYIDFAADGFNGTNQTIGFGAPGVLDRPVAADMDGDGIDDLGLWIPQSGSVSGDGEWRFLISDDLNKTKRVTGSAVTLAHPYSPTPLGHDIQAQFGNLPALPLVGNFDPPVTAGSSSGSGNSQTGGSANPASTPAGLTANEVFVSALYNTALGRDADNAGLNYWTNLLNKGTSRQQVTLGIQQSTEYRSRLIDSVYETYLGRDADASGRQWWLSQFANGATERQFTASLLASDEYFKNAGGSDFKFVQDLYQDVLGRALDGAAATWWTGQLANGAKRKDVAAQILGSDEALGAEAKQFYRDVLGREADATGLAYWVANMRGDGKEETTRATFIASDELYKQIATYLSTTNLTQVNAAADDFIHKSGRLAGLAAKLGGAKP